MPGPGTDETEPGTLAGSGVGVKLPERWPGGGDATCGTGEAKRAVYSARGTEELKDRGLKDAGDDSRG